MALNLYLALLRSKSLDTVGLAGWEFSHVLAWNWHLTKITLKTTTTDKIMQDVA